MNEHTIATPFPTPRRWHRLGLLGVSLAMAAPLWAQPIADPAPAAITTAAAEPPADLAPAPAALPVGQATRSLLQRQRDSTGADAGPRPLDGAMVDSAHQRYLKSFDQPLPAWFGQQVKTPAN